MKSKLYMTHDDGAKYYRFWRHVPVYGESFQAWFCRHEFEYIDICFELPKDEVPKNLLFEKGGKKALRLVELEWNVKFITPNDEEKQAIKEAKEGN